MSFNVRFSKAGTNEKAAENNWNDPQHPRRERAVRIVRETNPDLLGVQEARELQVEDFEHALPDYDFYGIGRDDGKIAGEFSGIFYRKGRFTRKDAGSFWLSATPEEPGTTFSYNKLPRIASWVRLGDNKSNREFVLLNMHWDHQDEQAREKSATLVRQRLGAIAKGGPIIVTGDLNSNEDTKAFATLSVMNQKVASSAIATEKSIRSDRQMRRVSTAGKARRRARESISFCIRPNSSRLPRKSSARIMKAYGRRTITQ